MLDQSVKVPSVHKAVIYQPWLSKLLKYFPLSSPSSMFFRGTGPFVGNQLKEGSRVFQQNLTRVSSWYIFLCKLYFLMTSKRIWCHTKASYWWLSQYSSPHSPLIPDIATRPSILIISGNQKANFKVSSQGQTSVYSNPLNFLGRFSTAIPVLTKQKRTKQLNKAS